MLGIYNRGDRRRRYWQCPHCRNWFEPDFSLLRWPNSSDPMESAEQAFMACPHCFESTGAMITQAMRPELDGRGVWLKDGQTIDQDGVIHGKARRSDIASFWLKGPNAGFAQWRTLVINYLLAMEEYDKTGNDRPLKTTINTDQGLPYTPPAFQDVRAPEDLMSKAKDFGEKVVPEKVRFLVA
ncbi:terminase gpA endonuclease subunit, partial [Arthrospira platensis SPKY1]|nr:terminase gpA endonuclease subunit [Arthrospira platensis SPKY1]